MSTIRWKFIAAVFGYALACRVLPYVLNLMDQAGFPIDPHNTWYPWNFSPVPAACVLFGAVVPKRKTVGLLLVALMIGGDLLIDFLTGFQWWTFRNQFVQLWVYGCVSLVAVLGMTLRARPNWLRGLPMMLLGVPTALIGEGFFFVITNFATWLSGYIPGAEAPMYPMTGAGLLACFAAGLPFVKWSMASTAIYAGLFFSPWGLSLAGVTPPGATEPAYAPEPALETVKG